MHTSNENKEAYLHDQIKKHGILAILPKLEYSDFEHLLPFFIKMKELSNNFIIENQLLKYILPKNNLKLLKIVINNNLYSHYDSYEVTKLYINNTDNLKFMKILEQAGFDFNHITLIKYLLHSKNDKSSYIKHIAEPFIQNYQHKYQEEWKINFYRDVFKKDNEQNIFELEFSNPADKFEFELFSKPHFSNILTFMELGIVFENKLIEHICDTPRSNGRGFFSDKYFCLIRT